MRKKRECCLGLTHLKKKQKPKLSLFPCLAKGWNKGLLLPSAQFLVVVAPPQKRASGAAMHPNKSLHRKIQPPLRYDGFPVTLSVGRMDNGGAYVMFAPVYGHRWRCSDDVPPR